LRAPRLLAPRRAAVHIHGVVRALVATLLVPLAACTSISTSSVKEHRDAGTTRTYDRPPGDLYQASLLALDRLQADPDWKELHITEQDRDRGVIIAERRLESRVIPGVGMGDAFGIFIDAKPHDQSEVTVVSMSSDQVPGSVGTQVASFTRGEGMIFPAIDSALTAIPESPRAASASAATAAGATQAPASGARSEPASAGVSSPTAATQASSYPHEHASGTTGSVASLPPAEPSVARGASSAGPMDQVYEVLRRSGQWRPLVRELGASGHEEIRVGGWARLTATERGITLAVREGKGSAANAAKLALELSQAGFQVQVEEDTAERR